MGEYKVKLQGPKKADYVITYKGLQEQLEATRDSMERIGWNQVTRSLREDVNQVRDEIVEFLIPLLKEKIVSFLKENPDVKTRNFKPNESGLKRIAWFYAKDELEKEGVLISTSHGKGRNRTWNLNQQDGNGA